MPEPPYTISLPTDAEVLADACRQALEALYNVPQVGEVYDQQHSDTHMRATLVLRAALKYRVTL